MKRSYIKWIVGILLSPIVLFILLTVLLYLPPVQRLAVRVATGYASDAMDMDVSIDDVRLKFPLDLKLDGVKAFRQNDSIKTKTDTILLARNIVCSVPLMPLFDCQVNIDEFNLEGVKVNTSDFIHSARIKGTLDNLTLQSHCIDLSADTLMLNNAFIKGANVDIALSDTVPEDTTKKETDWKIRVGKLITENSSVKVHLPGDTLDIGASITELKGIDGFFDLKAPSYRLRRAHLEASYITYDNNFEPKLQGLDFNHLLLGNAILSIDDFDYTDSRLSANIRECRMKEKCGLLVTSLTSHVRLDTLSVHLPDFVLKTPDSNICASVDLDYDAMYNENSGKLLCDIDGSVGKQDIMFFLSGMPMALRQAWPSQPLTVKGVVRGNMQKLYLGRLNILLPTIFRCRLDGFMTNVATPKHLGATLKLDATTYHLNPLVTSLVGNGSSINVPDGITAVGSLNIRDLYTYDADMTIREGGGAISGNAHINVASMAYKANLKVSGFNIGHFVKGMGLGPVSASIVASGSGTDIFSRSTRMNAEAHLLQFSYGKYNLNSTTARIALSGGHCRAAINASNSLLNGKIDIDALMAGRTIRASVGGDIVDVDVYRLGLVRDPLNVAVRCNVDFATDKRDFYSLKGNISGISLRDSSETYTPDDIVLDVLTDRTRTHAVVDCGDFHLNADLDGGYKRLLNTSNRLVAEIKRQIRAHTLDDMALRRALPSGHLELHTGRENPISRSLQFMGSSFAHADIDMTSTVADGPNGSLHIDTLKFNKDTQLDVIDLRFNSDPQKINYTFLVQDGPKNPDGAFRAVAEGYLDHSGLRSITRVYDEKDKLGTQIGLLASVEQQGLRLHIDTSEKVIIGYKTYSVNDDNYAFLRDDMRVSANLKLRSPEGTGLCVYSDDDNTDALQDVTVSLSDLNLQRFTSVLPYMPKLRGTLNGDVHLIKTTETMTVSSSVEARDLFYEGCPMGDLKLEFVYMPVGEFTHSIDGVLCKNDDEVATLKGTYDTRGDGSIEAKMKLERFPLDYANGFIPDQIIGFVGCGEGELDIKGSLSHPDVNGEVFLDSAALVSVPYGVRMRFDNDPVRIVGSKLLFENFQIYAPNNKPLLCVGSFDFSDTDRMRLDLRMKATNFMIIDAKESRSAEAYGRGYINFLGSISGELDRLRVRGRIDVLSKSDICYVLRDSPISTDNRLKELVTFTDFTSGMPVVIAKPNVDGLDFRCQLDIADGTHVKCWLNTDHTNYLDLVGGGELKFAYAKEKMTLSGRYTMTEGEMKYSLPVIPLKTFKIADGSFVQFNGDITDPQLSITANEETKAPVSSQGSVTKMVQFTCGVVLSKSLQHMGLQFVIDAPEDNDVHTELLAMTAEERGKLAVTMLTTGMYLSDGNTSPYSTNSALTTFLQSEINKISGSALRTIDLNVGVESEADQYGSLHAAYTFKFAKRFWNNRVSIAVGGKVNTGGSYSNDQNKTFFDNVEIQYRLGEKSNQYLRSFYKRNTYDYLEGYVSQYGGGYLWQRKLRRFRDIFRFRAPKDTVSSVPTDSAKK